MRASSTGMLATLSASSTARRMELTVESRLTMRPLRKPLDSAAPRDRNFTVSPSSSAMRMEVFVLPMSSPTRYLSFFANPPLQGRNLFCSCGFRARARFGIHDHLPRVLQINRLHAPRVGLPLRKIVDEHFELAGKIAGSEMDGDGLRVSGAGETSEDHAQVLGNRKVHFANGLRRAATHELDVLHKFLKQLHALFPLIASKAFRNACYDRELVIRVLGAVEDNAVGVNQLHFVAVAREGDGRAFRQFDANAIGKNAVHGRGFDPGNLLELAAAKVERNLQDAAIAVLREWPQHGFARDDVIARQLDLLGLEKQHRRRIENELCSVVRACDYGGARGGETENATVERPAAAAEFFAANFDGFLAAQVARLFFGNQLRAVALAGFRSRGGVPLHGLQAFQTTTSF